MPFMWDGSHDFTRRRNAAAVAVVVWELADPRGRILRCQVVDASGQLDLRCGYAGEVFLRSCSIVSLREADPIAKAWKADYLERGGYCDIPPLP